MTNRRSFLLGLGVSALGALAGCPRRSGRGEMRRGGRGERAVQRTQEIKRSAARFYEEINDTMRTGDLSLLDEVLAPDAVDHNPGPGQGPGRDGIKKAFGEFRAAFPDMHVTVEDMVAEGDKVACRIVTRMTHRGDFQGIRATGKQVTQSGIDILRITGGTVAERWGEFDTFGLLQQLGATTPAR
jgi:predicted ester cyclase